MRTEKWSLVYQLGGHGNLDNSRSGNGGHQRLAVVSLNKNERSRRTNDECRQILKSVALRGEARYRVVARERDRVKGRIFFKMAIIASCLFERDGTFAKAMS